LPKPTFIFFILALIFINVFFGYQILADLSSGYELNSEKLLTIIVISALFVLIALLLIFYQLIKHGYRAADIKNLYTVLKEEDLKRQKDSSAKLRWGIVDEILWTIIVANGAVLFTAHYVLIGLQVLDLIAVFAAMLSGVMLYAPLAFLFLYPVVKAFEKNYPSGNPKFLLSHGLICTVSSLIVYEKLGHLWWDPLLVGFFWITAGFVSFLTKKSRKFEVLVFLLLIAPLALLSVKCPGAILPILLAKSECSLRIQATFLVKLAALIFATLAAVASVLQVFGYKSLRGLSEKRKTAVEEGNYNPFRDPAIWIAWIALTSLGLLIALLVGAW
jgi:hypothetical protein